MIETNMPEVEQGRIVEMGNNYYIILVDNQRVLLRTEKNFDLDSTISFTPEFREISPSNQKYVNSFDDSLRKRDIIYEIVSSDALSVKSGKSIRSKLQFRVNKHPDHELLNSVMFNIKGSTATDFGIYFSSGLIIRGLVNIINKLLGFIFYEKEVEIISTVLLTIYGLVFQQYILIINIILYKLFAKMNLTNADSLFLTAATCIILEPSIIFNMGFQLIFIFRLCKVIGSSDSYLIRIVIVLIFQLWYFYRVNIAELIGFNIIRYYLVMLYVVSYIDVYFRTRLVSSLLIKIKLPQMYLSGKPTLVLLFMMIACLLQIISQKGWLSKIILVGLLLLNQYQLVFNPFLKVIQLSVGQGDALAIVYPFQRAIMMIDVGPSFSYKKVASFLDYYGITTIDTVIITHGDNDHNGNLELLINNYFINEIIDQHFDELSFNGLLIKSLNRNNYQNDNDNSIVTIFTINDYEFLLLGDVGQEVEQNLINEYLLQPDIVKLGHHGSNGSSSTKLLELSSIKLLINSSGRNNRYNHPSSAVLRRISDYNLPMLDTQEVGDIIFAFFFSNSYLIY